MGQKGENMTTNDSKCTFVIRKNNAIAWTSSVNLDALQLKADDGGCSDLLQSLVEPLPQLTDHVDTKQKRDRETLSKPQPNSQIM